MRGRCTVRDQSELRVPVPMPRRHIRAVPEEASFTIDCGDCRHQGSTVCSECVVSFIVDRDVDDAVVVDAEEARAVRLLERAGLVPGSRHERRVG